MHRQVEVLELTRISGLSGRSVRSETAHASHAVCGDDETAVSVFDDDAAVEERDGWETINVDGKQVGIKTSSLEEKCQAFETLVIYCSTFGTRFAPYLSQTLELVLPSLRFFFHDGVREASTMYVLSCCVFLAMLRRTPGWCPYCWRVERTAVHRLRKWSTRRSHKS